MGMHAVADHHLRHDRRERDPLATARRDRIGQLAQHHGVIGRRQAGGRHRAELVLAGAVLGMEQIDLDAGEIEGCHQLLGIAHGGAKRAQVVAPRRRRVGQGEVKLVLEADLDREPGLALQRRERALEKTAQAAFPGTAVGVGEIAEHEMLARIVGAEVDRDTGRGVRHQEDVADRAEGIGDDRVERGHRRLGRAPADALGAALVEVARAKGLAAHLARHVAAARHDQRFVSHRSLLHRSQGGFHAV